MIVIEIIVMAIMSNAVLFIIIFIFHLS